MCSSIRDTTIQAMEITNFKPDVRSFGAILVPLDETFTIKINITIYKMNRDIIFILPTFEERLQYYLGEMYDQKVKIKKEYIESILLRNLPQTSPTYDKIISIDNNKLSGIFRCQYTMDMEKILRVILRQEMVSIILILMNTRRNRRRKRVLVFRR